MAVKEDFDGKADHKNIVLVPEDAVPDTDKNYETVNSSLIHYSRKWNKEFAKMNRAGNELVKTAKSLNAQTAAFNITIYNIWADLEGMIQFMKQNPDWRK